MADFYNLFYGTKYQYLFFSSDGEVKHFSKIKHSKESIGIIDEVTNGLLEVSGMSLSDFDAFSVCIGPGSYTGLRVGLSYIKGITFALSKRLLTFDYFYALFITAFYSNAKEYDEYVVVLKAREDEYFMGSFNNESQQILKPALFRHDICKISLQKNFNRTLVISDTQDTIKELALSHNVCFVEDINLTAVADYINRVYMDGEVQQMAIDYEMNPLYLKEPYIKTKSVN